MMTIPSSVLGYVSVLPVHCNVPDYIRCYP